MRKHRFFLAKELQVGDEVSLDKELSHHITRVLRLHINDQIFIFNNSGYEYSANITVQKSSIVIVSVTDINKESYESFCSINLGQVIGKGDKLDFIIQKTTELGITSITPLYSEHSVVKKVVSRQEHKHDHWQKIAISACAQSFRNTVPTINQAMNLEGWIFNNQCTTKLICSPSNEASRLKNLQINGSVAILIGPEGGFSSQEIILAKQHGFIEISLGPRILRTETAGIVSVAIIQAIFGDL